MVQLAVQMQKVLGAKIKTSTLNQHQSIRKIIYTNCPQWDFIQATKVTQTNKGLR